MILFVQPKIQVASKYERRVDTRSYDDKKKLFEGVSIPLYQSNQSLILRVARRLWNSGSIYETTRFVSNLVTRR